MGRVLFRDLTVGEWLVVRGGRLRIKSRMRFAPTLLAVATKTRLFRCKATRPMTRVWQVQAVMFNSTWMGSNFKVAGCTQGTTLNKSAQAISRHSNKRVKQWLRTRLRPQTALASLFPPQNTPRAPIMWTEWVNKVAMSLRLQFRQLPCSKMQYLWIVISWIKAVQPLKTITRAWLIAAWTIN